MPLQCGHQRLMFVDAATLEDLNVIPAPTVRGTPLWSLINRTRSRTGSEALRQRLLNPPHEPDEILALQGAHLSLSADFDLNRRLLYATAPDEVERYLN